MEIFNSLNSFVLTLRRCNAQRVRRVFMLTSLMLPNDSPSISAFWAGTYGNFSKPSSRFLNNSTGIFPKIEILSFWRNFCWLRSEVFRRHLLWRGIMWKNKETVLFLFKRNLHPLGVSLLVLGGSACLFLRQPKGSRCDVTFWSQQLSILSKYTRFELVIIGALYFLTTYSFLSNS